MCTIRVFYDRAGILGRVYGEEETQSFYSVEYALDAVKKILPMMRKEGGKFGDVSFHVTAENGYDDIYVEILNPADREAGIYAVKDTVYCPSDGKNWTTQKPSVKMTSAVVRKHIAEFLTKNERKEENAA